MNFLLTSIFFLLPIVLIAGLIKKLGKSVNFYEYILLSSGSVLVSILLYLTVFSWINGFTAFDAMWTSFLRVFTNGAVDTDQLLSLYHQWGIFENFTTARQLGDYLVSQMKMVVPAAVILFSLTHGTALFLIIRLILKRLGYETSAVRSFGEWTLPKGMAYGLIILLLAVLLGRNLGISNLEVVYITFAALIFFLFMVMGLSMLWFFLKAGNVPALLRWILMILIFLLFGTLPPFIGLLDQLFQLRIRYRNQFIIKNGK